MDILLDEDIHDVIFVNGQAPVTQGQQQNVAQRLKIRLQTFLGEYFLNTTTGVPYYQRVFGKVRSKATVDAIFQSQILSDEGVLEIVSYQSSLDNARREFSLTFVVRTTEGITNPIQIDIGG